MDSRENRTELLRALGERVEALATSEGWQAWLQTAARFKTYSLRNQLLIAMQHPGATQVAGYRVWQSLGRQVRRGERAISILAPCVRKVDDLDTGDRRSVISGFKTVAVFDVSQTDGDPLPTIEMPAVSVVDGRLYERLIIVAQSCGLTVSTVLESPNGARGWYEPATKSITIVSTFDLGSRTRTLLHELSHAADHLDDEIQFKATTRAEKELVAESCAYLVGTSLAVDMADASTTYLASWSNESPALEHVAQRILKIAAILEAAICASDGSAVAA